MIRKKKKQVQRDQNHIDDFRTEDFRVFYAAPYFNLDLWYEIRWNKKHMEKLHKYAKKPHLYHQHHHGMDITDERLKHYTEHVIESIPFHRKILEEHTKRLKTVLEFMPRSRYKKISNISRLHGGTPEFFVFDKSNKDVFFVSEGINNAKKKWIRLVRDVHKLCDVVELR